MDGYKDLITMLEDAVSDLIESRELEGRFDAAQDYVNKAKFLDANVLCAILGLEVKNG